MIIDVVVPQDKIEVVYEYIVPKVQYSILAKPEFHLVVYIPDGLDPVIRNEVLVYLNQFKGDE